MKLFEIMKELAKNGVTTSMRYDVEQERFYIDLETQAKSHRYLYEDGEISGRYGYTSQLNFVDSIDDLITELCWEFKDSICDRDYYSSVWANLCASKGIEI